MTFYVQQFYFKNILKHLCFSVYRCKYESKYDTKEMLYIDK
jgi:hypothetical protein